MTHHITILDSTTFYRPVLELYSDGDEHKNVEIREKIRNMLNDDEKDSKKVKTWVDFPIKHFRDAGCLKRVKNGIHSITEDGLKLLNKDIDSLDRKVLNIYCPKFRQKYGNFTMENDDITFNQALNIIKDILEQKGTVIGDNYDKILVKRLEDADIVGLNKSGESSGNTTHIALTSEKMDIFPFLVSYDYFYNEKGKYDQNSKSRFLLEVPVFLYYSNIQYLDENNEFGNNSDIIPTTATVLRSRKNKSDWTIDKLKRRIEGLENLDYDVIKNLLGYDIQAEFSSRYSGEDFKKFRKLLYKDYYLIILKYNGEFKYDIFAVKPNDGDGILPKFELYTKDKIVTTVSYNLWTTEKDYSVIKDGGENLLFYGVPGCGKSSIVEKEYCSDESHIERVVFHQDYTYADFIGQILPEVSEGKVTYKFFCGPFTSILRRACQHPGEKFYLIIEEINRGNAPAIFGDVFQLLDRKTKSNDDFPIGTSEYGITNHEIADKVYGDKKHKVRIPPNLSIIATMNTADQNVFTLDTAFQRRWNMKLVPNKFDDHKFADTRVLDTDITWKNFVENINELILDKNTLTTSSEDKRLGVYFVREEDLKTENVDKFAEKVLKYLWDDAFKFSRDRTFISKCKSLEEIIDKFKSSKGNSRFDIFIDKNYIITHKNFNDSNE